MGLRVNNYGTGYIGPVARGWNINYNSSPIDLARGTAKLGDISFGAACNGTSKFTIDNYISVRHYYDDPNDLALGGFDGYIRSLKIKDGYGQFGMNSLLGALDVTRAASADPSGTYQRTISIEPVSYIIGSTTYWVGGYYTSEGSQNVFKRQDVPVYDVAAGRDFLCLLVQGGHSGECVLAYRTDGEFYSVFPVYSDATDLANPGSNCITMVGDSIVWVGQTAAKRVKRFSLGTGAFVNQFGSLGSGNGQFQAIGDIAVDQNFDSLFVTDPVLGRVQRFQWNGTYSTQFGTSGSGSGNLVFNAPRGIAVDMKTHNVLVADNNARVREYTSAGVYVSQPMGRYNFLLTTSMGEFRKNTPISLAFDDRGNAYALNNGIIYKYYRKSGTDWSQSTGKPVMQWNTAAVGTNATGLCATSTGVLHSATAVNGVDQYAGSLGDLMAHIFYYFALAAPNLKLDTLNLNNRNDGGTPYLGWHGNVLQHLTDLLAVTKNKMHVYNDRIIIGYWSEAQVSMPENVIVSPMELDSRPAGSTVEVLNHRATWTGYGLLYSAYVDGNRVVSVDAGEIAYLTVNQGTHPECIIPPTPVSASAPTPGASSYVVIDSNNAIVDPTTWGNYGGQILAYSGDNPGDIDIQVFGPRGVIPGTDAPYRIAAPNGQAALNIYGSGILTDPEWIEIGTGANTDFQTREVAERIETPFILNADQAYTEGSWVAYNAATPTQHVDFTIRYSEGFQNYDTVTGHTSTANAMGLVILHDDCHYVIESISANEDSITYSTYRRVAWGSGDGDRLLRPEQIWNTKTAADFNAYWAGYTAQDFKMAPLRSPYTDQTSEGGLYPALDLYPSTSLYPQTPIEI